MLVAPLCLPLCDPMDCSPPGSSVYGISQARILEWVASSFSRGIFLTQGSSHPWIEPGCPKLQSDALPSELPGKPRKTVWVHSNSLQSCPFCDLMDYSPPGSSVQWDFPGKNTGVGCHALLQGICLTRGSKPSSVAFCRQIFFFYH